MKKHPAPSSQTLDLDAIRANLTAADDAARARAVRQLCPCRTGWDAFQESMDQLKMLQKDPDPQVRGAALHVFEDAFGMDNGGLPTSPQTLTNEMAARKRRLRWQPLEEPDEALPREPEWKQHRRDQARDRGWGRPEKK